MNTQNQPDSGFWAKRFDTVKHIYGNSGTLCKSSAFCLGNNYATKGMEVCKECQKIKDEAKR